MMQIRFFAMASALLWSTTAMSAPAQTLQPVDKWALDFGETQCTAARTYGDAANPTILGIVPSFNANYYKVLVSVPRSGPALAKELRGTADFGRGPISADMLYYGKPGVKQSVYQFGLSGTDFQQAGAATGLTVATDRMNATFALSDMTKLLSALSQCTGNLRQYWNAGASGITPGTPLTGIPGLLTPRDYPSEAARLHPRASLRYQLLVDEKGAVTGCDALVPSGAQVVDETGCQVLTAKARFRPAVNASGKAVKSAWTTPPLTWSSRGESAFDSGCSKMTSDGASLEQSCNQLNQQRLQTPIVRSPPPPPPPPSSH
jgi:hypothetical protein